MPVAGKEKGIRSDYEVRFGITHPTFLGVNTQKPAFSLLDSEGVAAENVRIKGGRPVERGGQEKVNVLALEPIHGFTDTTSDAGVYGNGSALNPDLGTPYGPMYVIGNNAVGVEGTFVHVDTDTQVVVTTGIHDAGRPSAVPIDYNGGHYGAIAWNETDTEVVTVPGLVSLFQLPRVGTIATCCSLLALGTDLLAAYLDSGQAMRVSLWDGANLTADLSIPSAGGGGTCSLGEFQGTAYLALNPTGSPVNSLYRRNGNAVWASLAYPDATAFHAHHLLKFQGRLYIIGEDSDLFVIYSTDGNTLVKEHTVAGSVATTPAVSQLAVVRDGLYYWFHDGTTGLLNRLGKFDGASWEDDHNEDLVNDVGPLYTRGMGFVGTHDGANLVFADDSGNIDIFQSDGINLFGTWTKVLTYAAGVYGVGSGTPPARVGLVRT